MYEGNDHTFSDGIMKFVYEPTLGHPSVQATEKRAIVVCGTPHYSSHLGLAHKSSKKREKKKQKKRGRTLPLFFSMPTHL